LSLIYNNISHTLFEIILLFADEMIVQKMTTRWRGVKERGDRWKPDDARGGEGIREGRGIGAVPCVPLAILVSLRRA
jgi:hypothetical protein